MKCRNHPEQDATALCQKLGVGFCTACCACEETAACCGCLDPQVYCQFRSQCLVWELSRPRRKKP